jgi:glycosyltransferase involved in cell wall biosynthesis
MAKATLILSFYNKMEVLKLVLASLELQSAKDFEVIIADDGSNKEVVSAINTYIGKSKLAIKHCWHPDNGWQKNKILNQAVREAASEYYIFVDGDCLLHKHFIREHLAYAENDIVLTGRRVNLSPRVTNKLSVERIKNGYLGNPISVDLLLDMPFGKVKDWEQGLYLGGSGLATWLNRKEKGILGSNFSINKQNFYDVNGFDERFELPAAGEDTDIEHRLLRNGCKVRTVRNRAIQYHIFHQELNRPQYRLKYLHENDAAQLTYTPFGINQEQ